jgi:hypothetical protein
MRAFLALAVGLLVGCHSHHYVVLDEAPLYASAGSSEEVARLPRYHHEELGEEPEPRNGRVAVRYRGQVGYAPASAVRVFSYLDPALDEGDDRQETIQRELREAQLADLGGGWDADVVEAVRDGEVTRGMTRRQVELAWGWPATVRAGSAGGERWIYYHDTYETVQRYVADAWAYPSSYSPYAGFHWAAVGRRGFYCDGWIDVRLPVTEERVVELDARGRVAQVHVRRFLRSGAVD